MGCAFEVPFVLTPATSSDLARVIAAGDEFRALWTSLRSMPYLAPFDGGPNDIRALDYLDYESLAYPPGGIAAASLVWGNVLAKQVGFEWVRSDRGDQLLAIEEPGYRFVVWPFGRVYEVQCRSIPQDDKYGWLFAWVLRECLELPGSLELEERVQKLLAAVGGSEAV